jgi:glutamyl-Q tRNA(Asp) synthetase
VITRFAPAPTGYLHIGHVLNAIYVWETARRLQGRVMLRIEDHDRQRSRPEYEHALREDLAWLGFSADDESRQSDRDTIYEDALARLRARGLVYACACTRKEFSGERYPGTCRDKALADEPGLGVRVRIEPGDETFDDLRLGEQRQTPSEQCGDILLRDRLGFWTYQFAATVDDLVQGITHVVRGEDLLASTGRQIRLARLLGRETPPVFLHHPLIMKTPDQKVSKSDGDTGVRDLRAAGWTPAQLMAEAAARGGLINGAAGI